MQVFLVHERPFADGFSHFLEVTRSFLAAVSPNLRHGPLSAFPQQSPANPDFWSKSNIDAKETNRLA